MTPAEIRNQIAATKINAVQIDPNGFCNSACWCCPRAYAPSPPHATVQMPLAFLESIVSQCAVRRGVLAVPRQHIWTANYNEVLLYHQFGAMLEIFAKYAFTTTLLSNGTLFDDSRIALVAEHVRRGTIRRICLNIIAGDPESYRRYTGRDPGVFERMREGVSKLIAALPRGFLEGRGFDIAVNGIDDARPEERRGILSGAPELPVGDLPRQVEKLQSLFPGVHVWPAGARLDRGGHLARYGVLSNRELWPKPHEKVAGCRAGETEGGRPFGWLHVNAAGEVFLCCSDYDFSYVFGDLTKQSIEEAWLSEAHVDTIYRAFWTICRTCASAERK